MSSPTTYLHERYTDVQVSAFRAAGFWHDEILYGLVEAQADRRPDAVFVLDGTTSLTYGQVREEALRVAVGLRRLGVGRGDRVAVQLPNWCELVTVLVAVGLAGGVVVPIMPVYREDEVGYVLEHSGAKVSVT